MRFQAPESLSEQIAQHLGQRIIQGALRPGERIQEMKVAGELDVSRGSVREALLILERRHLIQIFPRKGAVVSGLSPELVTHLYDIYADLVILLAQKLALQWEGQDLAPLARQIGFLETRIQAPDVEPREIIEAGFEVMRLASGVVRNPFLEETLENFRPAISRTYFLALQQYRYEAESTRSFFQSLVEHVQARDTEAIADAVHQFSAHQRSMVLNALEEDESLSSGALS